MGFTDIIAIAIIVLVIGCAVAYIIKAKRSGKRCIGCPDSCSCTKKGCCSGNCSGNCGGCTEKEEDGSSD